MSKDFTNKDSGRDSINEMEQIQKGLEAFLQQELKEMQDEKDTGGTSRQPQLFTIGEEENQEKEIDIIGSSDRGRRQDNRRNKEDYFEDWDSGEPVRDRKTQTYSRDTRQRTAGQGKKGSKTSGGKNAKASGGNAKAAGKSSRKKEAQTETKGKASQPAERKQKKRKKKRSGLKKFLITVAVLLVFLAGGLYLAVGAVYAQMNYEPVESVSAQPMKEEGVVNILLIGNDSRENGEDGRSDAMILLSISNKTKKIYMTSLLRDMYVEIPGHDNNRLNAAYSFGGAELLMETVEQNFDITVNRYVLVNFEAFANLVDAVGGVDLELTSEEIEYVNGYLVEYNMLLGRPEGTDYMDTSQSGLVHLNGPQALAYCRNRYLGTDFGRTERQRKVLSAVIGKLPSALLTNPGELIGGLMPNLTTNLTQGECFRLSLMAYKLLSYDIIQNSIPLEGTYSNATIRQMAVLEVDFEANKAYLRENIYGESAQ